MKNNHPAEKAIEAGKHRGIKKGQTDVTRVRPLVGDLIWIQTRNLLIRSQMLYSVDL